MMKHIRKILRRIAPPIALVVIVIVFSAFYARRACDEIVQTELAPPPRRSTRFVLYPGGYVDGADRLGFRPGWVVIYASRSREYGTAFFVSFFGKMLARGTPTIVAKQHKRDEVKRKQDEVALEPFRENFARADAAVQVGTSFSNVVSLLGKPHDIFTNQDGSLSVYYDYMPPRVERVELTNGFSLIVRNGIVVVKGYSYTSMQ